MLRPLLLICACCLGLFTPVAAQSADAARVVLVGPVPDSAELQTAVTELLQREGVDAMFATTDQLSSEALLSAPDGDRRVHVYLTLVTPRLAKLYVRGPGGQRFLLRELSLRSGADELGRESIAQVVATSTHALLHSSEGLDRETARVSLANDPQLATPVSSAVPASPSPAAAPMSSPVPSSRGPIGWRALIGARAVGGYAGDALGARWGGGLEVGLARIPQERFAWRARVVFEQFATQQLEAREIAAETRIGTLLMGVDLGLVMAPHTLLFGLSAGVDMVHVAAKRPARGDWILERPSMDRVPVMRAEVRYERALSSVLLAASLYADTSLLANRFEVNDGGDVREVAAPWRVTPGLAFTLGWQSR